MEVRCYEDRDEQAVIDLWRTALPDSAPHNDPATSIARKLAVDRDLFFVATIAETVVGTARGGYDGHRGWIYSVAVDPQHRRKGIGTALLERVEAALVERGCPKVNLQVRESNAEVVAFYESLGYETERRINMGKRLYS